MAYAHLYFRAAGTVSSFKIHSNSSSAYPQTCTATRWTLYSGFKSATYDVYIDTVDATGSPVKVRIYSSSTATTPSSTWDLSDDNYINTTSYPRYVEIYAPSSTTYKYSLTLYGNGGTWSSMTELTYNVTSTSTSYEFNLDNYTKPERTGYKFAGWYTASSGGASVNTRTATTSTPNVSVYAHWTKTYTLSYNANGGTSTPTGGNYTHQEQVTLANAISHNDTTSTITTSFNGNGGTTPSSKTSTLTRAYSFNKWSYNSTLYKAGSTFTMPSSNVTMTANWSITATPSSITLPSSTRDNYALKGWYTAASGGTRVGGAYSTINPISDNTYYAQWTPYYSVQLGKNITAGGTVTGAGSYLEGATATISASANSGYTFDYWYDSNSTIISFNSSYSFEVTGDVRYYAHFTQSVLAFDLTYDPNGGTGSAITDRVQGTPQSGYITATLRGATFTKDYSTQTGWHTSGGTEYALNSTISINADTTVYASWTHETTSFFYWLGSDSADNNQTTGIMQGALITNLTATVWKRIGAKINSLEILLGMSQTSFTTSMQSGDVFLATYYNEVITALNRIKTTFNLTSITVPNPVSKGIRLFYYFFNGAYSVKWCLNNIIQWYNTR